MTSLIQHDLELAGELDGTKLWRCLDCEVITSRISGECSGIPVDREHHRKYRRAGSVRFTKGQQLYVRGPYGMLDVVEVLRPGRFLTLVKRWYLLSHDKPEDWCTVAEYHWNYRLIT